MNGWLRKQQLRDPGFLQAAVLASLQHLGGWDTPVTCDEIARELEVGRGGEERAPTGYLERLRWWWKTRGCECHWQEPYGPVVMVGCPFHDRSAG